MKFKIINISAVLFTIIILFGCQKKEDIGNTSTVNMSGEWFIEYFDATDPATALDHHSKILTYNTSLNDGKQVWVQDDNFWPFKAKMDVDYANLSFKAMNQTEDFAAASTSYMKIIEGKVLPKMGKSKSGNVVDSIYLKVEFTTDDPGVIYEIRGHQRTGFFEDEY